MAVSMDPNIWIAAIWTLAVLTYLIRQTHITRIAEHAVIASWFANTTLLAVEKLWTYISSIPSHPTYIVPLVLGWLMFVPSFSTKQRWVSRYPIAIMVGVGTGLATAIIPQQMIIDNIILSIRSLGDINSIVLIGIICAVIYNFVFTHTPTSGALGTASRWIQKFGRYALLAGYGVGYTQYMTARIAVFTGRVQFLVFEWLKLRAV